MKKLFIVLIAFFASFAVKAQGATGVVNALKSGNAEKVAVYFDKILDLKFPDKEEIKGMGKNQAGVALQSFFDGNGIKGFDLSSLREMGGTTAIAGKLTNGSEGFKISIMMKTKDGVSQIVTIRIS